MNERQQTILTCLIDHFIDSCQPISSAMVKDRLEIQLSPASVRQVFLFWIKMVIFRNCTHLQVGCQLIKGIVPMLTKCIPNAFNLDTHVDEQTYHDKFRFLFDQFMDRLSQKIPYVTILKINHQELSDLASIQYVPLNSHPMGYCYCFIQLGLYQNHSSFPIDVSGWIVSP